MGIEKFSSLNPGSLAAWPITGQKELFEIIGRVSDIGVSLQESFMMLPLKSASGLIFATDEEWHNCMRCPRTDCPNRRAEYEGNM